ncbi:MAG: hypothetical protein CMK29_05875 [Porticoccaceae bacterium]|nr:hypothetical protein [Porticoccaceae bacterium]OUW58403.1 MAG: hypothetical protein CBD57_02495 [Candidatus Pelagibacter sp. TMED197]|tara:strand:+ start:5178 stop:5669 length:492 start_codon:yes stop_codon:yes gene_type:complete
MKNFNYKLNYKKLNFRKPEIRKLYRIGRGEQGVLLVRPYTNIICRNWRFKTPQIAEKSANTIYHMYRGFRALKDFVGMDMCRKFLEMGFTRARRYANHKDGKKYKDGKILPQEKDWATSEKAKSASIFKKYRDLVTTDKLYIIMRKNWREIENAHEDNNTQRI